MVQIKFLTVISANGERENTCFPSLLLSFTLNGSPHHFESEFDGFSRNGNQVVSGLPALFSKPGAARKPTWFSSPYIDREQIEEKTLIQMMDPVLRLDGETTKARSTYRERMTKSERDCAQIMDDFDRARARFLLCGRMKRPSVRPGSAPTYRRRWSRQMRTGRSGLDIPSA